MITVLLTGGRLTSSSLAISRAETSLTAPWTLRDALTKEADHPLVDNILMDFEFTCILFGKRERLELV